MHPGAVAVGGAGGAVMDVRAAARAGIMFGLASAAIALVAATINPGDFHAQIVEQAAPDVLVAMSYAVLLGVSLAVTCCSW